MEEKRIAVLKADLGAKTSEIDKIYERIDERAKGKSQVDVEGLGYWLHNLYCAFEDAFKLVAAFFENNVDAEAGYHIEILKRMSVSIEGVRPAFVSDEALPLLDNLRAFRHVLRHAYVYDLDERKVRLVCEDAQKLRKIFRRDIAGFLDQL